MDRYEFDSMTALEKFEWDNCWIEDSNNGSLPAIFYIGDSISCGTRGQINKLEGAGVLCDGFGTSKGIDNPIFAEAVKLFASQRKKYSAVVFNNGLHGWHLDDENEYAVHYEKFVREMREFFGEDVPFFILLSTTVLRDEKTLLRVKTRNKVAKEIAKKLSLPVIDIYEKSEEVANPMGDGVHFTPEGYMEFAKIIVKRVKDAL